jgi:hypothetical protein
MIRDLLILDTDSELFLKKTVDDLDFIDTTMEALLSNLIENTNLIKRNEELDNLYDLEWQFSQVLIQFFSNSGNISVVRFPVLRDRLQQFQTRCMDRRKIIEDSGCRVDKNQEPVVSRLELEQLLQQ